MINKKIFYIIITLIIILFVIISVILSFLFIYSDTFNKENNNNKANLVFITDYNYKKYTQVAILSAILNKNENSIYDISILCVDINKKDMEEYNKLVKYDKYNNNNVIINTIPVTLESIKDVGNYEISHPYASRADLFKFFLPDILKDKDKVLYIDGDTIIRKDLLELYNTNLKNRYLGAVKIYIPIHTWHKIINNWYYRTVNYNYNCGVLLLNLKKMREDDLKTKFINWKKEDKNRDYMSQRAFNEVIPLKSIIKLSPVYNYKISIIVDKPSFEDAVFKLYNFKKVYFPYLININSNSELCKRVAIAHFSSEIKPWHNPNEPFSDEWWEYAHMVDKNWKYEKQKYKDISVDSDKLFKNIKNRKSVNRIEGFAFTKDIIYDHYTHLAYCIYPLMIIPSIAQIYKAYY